MCIRQLKDTTEVCNRSEISFHPIVAHAGVLGRISETDLRHAYAHEALAIYRSILFFPMLHKTLALAIFVCAHVSYHPPELRVLVLELLQPPQLGSDPRICALPLEVSRLADARFTTDHRHPRELCLNNLEAFHRSCSVGSARSRSEITRCVAFGQTMARSGSFQRTPRAASWR